MNGHAIVDLTKDQFLAIMKELWSFNTPDYQGTFTRPELDYWLKFCSEFYDTQVALATKDENYEK